MKLIFLAGVSFSSILGGRTVQLARVLASGHEIHFVEIPSLRRPRLLPACRDCDGIAVHALPPRWGQSWFRVMATYIRKNIGTEDAVAFVSNPFWQPLLKELPGLEIAYDCLDYVAIHCPGSAERFSDYTAREQWLIDQAKHVFAVSAPLIKLIGKPEKCVLLPNAVPASWLEQPIKTAAEPVIGFHGALYEWVDYELLERTADAFPECKLRLVGPIRDKDSVAGLSRRANVELLPAQPFNELPETIGSFRVGLIPFCGDEVARCADPLKTYEYLSMGKPVLTTVPPVKENPFVTYAPPEHFVEELRALLQRLPDAQACRDSVRQEIWTERADLLISTLSGGNDHA